MTDQQHPITLPFELVEQWIEQCLTSRQLAAMAFQAGADAELEACCEWLDNTDVDDSQEAAKHLRAARRPKPPSLKAQAFEALAAIEGDFNTVGDRAETIRRALEALDD